MPKLELQKGHKIFLSIAGVVFLGSGTGLYFSWDRWKALEEEEATLEQQITTSTNKIRKVDDLEKDVIILRENLQHYVRILPSDAEVNEFYRTIQDFVNYSGVQITELNPQPQRGKMTTSQVFDRAEYKLRFQCTFAQLLQFINRIENHERFVSISEIKIKAGQRKNESEAEPTHDVNLSVVTFVYRGNEVGQGVQIANYDRKRTQLSEQIAEARHDLALDRFQLLSEGVRRDPLVDPRIRITEETIAGVDITEQRNFLDTVSGQIEECHALFDLMESAGSVMREMELRVEAIGLLTEIQVKVDEAISRNLVTAPNLRREFEGVVFAELERLRLRAGESEQDSRPDKELIRIRSALTQMTQAFEAGKYQECVDTFEMVSSLTAGVSASPEVARIQADMEAIFLAATTALDFMEMNITVTGLVRYEEEGEREDRESVAIVNNIVYREGEAIADDLFLLEIGEDHLVFEYRGIPLTFDY